MPRVAGIDLNVNNMAAIGYSCGRRAAVHSAGRFDAVMADFTDRIGDRVSKVTPERAKELQAKKNELREKEEKLPRNEEMELRKLLREIYADAEYRRLTAEKKRWMNDYLHKTSRKIVDDCVERKIDVIVIGRNKLWKQNSNMGRVQNRRFCQLAHATLIGMIRYKAEFHGIAVLTTEESYTSKTSFVNDDVLECYADKTHDIATINHPAMTGKRSSADRNWFCHKNRDDRWKRVHADVNGAFNIVRKVFKKFRYDGTQTLRFTLLRMSPRLGVVPVVLKELNGLG
jgi:putative transposase